MNEDDKTVLDAIAAAAAEGRLCPTNETLVGLLRYDTKKMAIACVKRLEAAGLITVRRWQTARQVTIVATGATTARPAGVWTEDMLAGLCDLVAAGLGWPTVEERMGITPATRASMWREVCRDLGWQAV